MAPRLDYREEIGNDLRAQQWIDEVTNFTVGPLGCWLASGSTNTDGYVQIWRKPFAKRDETGRKAQRAYLLHTVSYLADRGVDTFNANLHVSHLCDIRNCFNPAHLHNESAKDNNARKGCLGSIVCNDHQDERVELCEHEPRCIRAAKAINMPCCSKKSKKRKADGLLSPTRANKQPFVTVANV